MLQKKIGLLLKKLPKLSDNLFVETDGGRYSVLWLLDRQKPSVERDYDFDEERFGITSDGKIIWGFDSGCSCPSPWSQADFEDQNYKVKEWKEFMLDKFPEFDVQYEEEIIKCIDKLLE
ncbi:MAG: hypothetical protein WC554_08370 [Clostridia bacterium]